MSGARGSCEHCRHRHLLSGIYAFGIIGAVLDGPLGAMIGMLIGGAIGAWLDHRYEAEP